MFLNGFVLKAGCVHKERSNLKKHFKKCEERLKAFTAKFWVHFCEFHLMKIRSSSNIC